MAALTVMTMDTGGLQGGHRHIEVAAITLQGDPRHHTEAVVITLLGGRRHRIEAGVSTLLLLGGRRLIMAADQGGIGLLRHILLTGVQKGITVVAVR